MKGRSATTNFLVWGWAQNKMAINAINRGCSGRMPTKMAVTASHIPRHINKVRSSRLGGQWNVMLIFCPLFLVQLLAAMHDTCKCGQIGEYGNDAHGYDENHHRVEGRIFHVVSY